MSGVGWGRSWRGGLFEWLLGKAEKAWQVAAGR